MKRLQKKVENTLLCTPNILQSQFPVEMFPVMAAARERERDSPAFAARVITLRLLPRLPSSAVSPSSYVTC